MRLLPLIRIIDNLDDLIQSFSPCLHTIDEMNIHIHMPVRQAYRSMLIDDTDVRICVILYKYIRCSPFVK